MNRLSSIQNMILHNRDLINKSAMKNCHAIGLNSFIINEKPRMRLFIAERGCELFNEFDPANPLIAIHSHKYHDTFFPIHGTLIHHLYRKPIGPTPPSKLIEFNRYKYVRLCDTKPTLFRVGQETLEYLGQFPNKESLSSKELHTAHLTADNRGRCCWLIVEGEEDKDFNQVAYHQNLTKRPELYQKLEDGFRYLKKYFSLR